MDSPDSSNPNTNQSVPAQDSPIFSYISNLSPIQSVKTPAVTQGFPCLSSPPLVFTSPQLNCHSQSTFFKRKQLHGLSAAKTSRPEECCESNVIVVNASGNLDIHMSTSLVPCVDKGLDTNVSVKDQMESHKAYSNRLFADVMNMDPNSSAGSIIKNAQLIDKSHDAATLVEESAMKINDELNARKNEEAAHHPALSSPTENILRNATSYANFIESGADKEDYLSLDNPSNVEPESPLGHTIINQDQKTSMNEVVDIGVAATLDLSSHMPPGSKQIAEQSEYLVWSNGVVSTEPILKKVRNDAKAPKHRGLHRRCLQFEDAPYNAVSEAPATTSAHLNGNRADFITPKSSSKNNFNSISQNPMALHIGLHLNRFSSSAQAQDQFGTVLNVKSAHRGKSSIQGKKSMQMFNSHLSDNSKLSSLSSPVDSFSSRTDVSREIGVLATSSATYSTESPKDCANLNQVEEQSTSVNKKSENGVSNEVNKSCTTKKRKRSCDPDNGDGCKRCNCKKSNCLKLYCDCFAAGLYCVEPCACQSCLNRPEYEGTVLDKRKQIESRNPLAFAPKVVQRSVEPPTNSSGENPIYSTPSARHKRGCNCKRSMCLKKYCECYQANVGCSDECRCEGCKNVFGQKKVYVASGNGLFELQNPNHNITPQTPAFQFSNHRKDNEAWFPSQQYFQSPEPLSFITTNENIPYDSGIDDDHTEQMNEVGHQPGKMLLLTGIISNPRLWTNNANNGQTVPLDTRHSWNGLPNTPMVQCSETRIVEVDDDDDTPDILKDDPTPIHGVQVRSPNKKRVSPPHGQLLRSTSSSGLFRTGRKFILQSVPSFSPLTPCIDSKVSDAEQSNDPKS